MTFGYVEAADFVDVEAEELGEELDDAPELELAALEDEPVEDVLDADFVLSDPLLVELLSLFSDERESVR